LIRRHKLPLHYAMMIAADVSPRQRYASALLRLFYAPSPRYFAIVTMLRR